MTEVNHKQCNKCILDTHDDPEIQFDNEGICNYCRTYEAKYDHNWPSQEELAQKLKNQIQEIKNQGKNKKHDSILGVSGGVDSTYFAMKAKEWGLNPLLIHYDNGWNTELAVQNINAIVENTGFKLFTYVVDWEEFKDLQLSYIRAGVLDWEIPTDHGFNACLYDQSYNLGINAILTGHNYQTESILPKTMRWNKLDTANLHDIQNKFGSKKLKSFPTLNFWKYNFYGIMMDYKRYNLLELIDYDKGLAKKEIMANMGWKDYGGKHYESFFTKFYQGYVLCEKFGYDKRKAHLSNLICSHQITKEQALEELAKPSYAPEKLEEDIEYFIKKMNLTRQEFNDIMAAPVVPHTHYKSYETGLYRQHERFMRKIKPITSIVKKFIGKLRITR